MLSPDELEDPQVTSEQLLSLESDIEIINMLEEFTNRHCPNQFKEIENGGKISKSNEKAVKLREEGNKYLNEKKFLKALLSFTESIANAENKSEELGKAYADRSALLFQREYYKECLEDIEQALVNNCPEETQRKLKTRKESAETNKSQQVKNTYHEDIPVITNPNTKIACAANSVEIQKQQNDSYVDRNVVATRKIKAGEIISVEKPYAVAVGVGPSQKYLHCHDCLELCINLIPCPNCRTALYCSKKCREKALQQYHYNECDLCQFDFVELLSLKIVLKSLKESPLNGVEENGDLIYKSDSYKEIRQLQGNKENRTVRDFFEATNEACIYYHFLKQYSDFFDNTKTDGNHLKELLFHHYFTTGCNKIAVEKIRKTSINTEFQQVGEALYSFASLLNHDCFGNVTPTFYGSTIVLRAARDIQPGESCCLTYRNYNFAEYPKLLRAFQLWQKYYFTCKCISCEKDWPIFDLLETGDTVKYLQLVELLDKFLEDSTTNKNGMLNNIINQIKASRVSEIPSKVDVNTRRIFCDLFKMFGNKIFDVYFVEF